MMRSKTVLALAMAGAFAWPFGAFAHGHMMNQSSTGQDNPPEASTPSPDTYAVVPGSSEQFVARGPEAIRDSSGHWYINRDEGTDNEGATPSPDNDMLATQQQAERQAWSAAELSSPDTIASTDEGTYLVVPESTQTDYYVVEPQPSYDIVVVPNE